LIHVLQVLLFSDVGEEVGDVPIADLTGFEGRLWFFDVFA
jgi:hypothetical protein